MRTQGDIYVAAKRKAMRFLAAHPDVGNALDCGHHLCNDMRATLYRDGRLSEKKIEFLLKLKNGESHEGKEDLRPVRKKSNPAHSPKEQVHPDSIRLKCG